MGLSSSMWSSVSGLLSHGDKMNVIGNNIANVSTIGFKGQRMDFQDFIYQDSYSASGPTQIGRGVSINAVLGDFSQGSFETTNDPMDMAIGGKGYFQVKDSTSDQVWYTRAGDFRFDAEGYLKNPQGHTLQGWKIDNSDGPTIATGATPVVTTKSAIQGTGVPTDIVLDSWTVPPKQTTKVQVTLNLTSDAGNDKTQSTTNPFFALSSRWNGTQPPTPAGSPPLSSDAYAYQTSIKVFDETGTSHTLTTYFDQVTPEHVDDLPTGYKMYEYVTTMDPAEDQRTFGGVYDPLTGLLQDGTPTLATATAITATNAPAAAGANLLFGSAAPGNGSTYQQTLDAIDLALGNAPGTTTNVGIQQLPSGAWRLDTADATVAAAVAAGLDASYVTFGNAAAADPIDDINKVKKFSEYKAGGLLVRGTITFNSAGQMVNQTAYTYQGDTVLAADATYSANPNNLSSWEPTAVSNNGYPVFTANFTGQPMANSVRQSASNNKPDASKYLVELNFGMKCGGNLDEPWGPPPLKNAGEAISQGGALASYSDLQNFVVAQKEESSTTSLSGSSVTRYNYQNGYASGDLTNTSVDSDGVISGIYSNGITMPLYQITLYNFVNPQGLRREGGNLFSATLDSGNPQVGPANQNGMGSVNSYSIEQSNVDMAREFVQMITTQRGFQANSKGITTVDQMLETVIGMKR